MGGATRVAGFPCLSMPGFNPRARGGRDISIIGGGSVRSSVSIHAPVGGATDWLSEHRQIDRVSIHAPVGGATSDFVFWEEEDPVSIHAPVGGATELFALFRAVTPSFNPRARGGRDCAPLGSLLNLWVSIHAPVGGATGSAP